MKASTALEEKVKVSVGLIDRAKGELGFTNDLVKENNKAESRRDIESFETKLRGLNVGAEEIDSDDEEAVRDGLTSGVVVADLSWSDQAEEINRLAKWKKLRHVGRLDYLRDVLRTLRLKQCGIDRIDKDFSLFSSLEELNLSHNQIKVVENLPPKLISLQVYNNSIKRLDIARTYCAPRLVHLGLGYNDISMIGSWVEDCISLQSLDLCFNSLVKTEENLMQLSKLGKLRTLSLEGNPFCLLQGYRRRALQLLPNVSVLDGLSRESHQEGFVEENPVSTGCVKVQIHSIKLNRRVNWSESPEFVDTDQSRKFMLAVEISVPGSTTFRTEETEIPDIQHEESGEIEGDGKEGSEGEEPLREQEFEIDLSAAFELQPSQMTRDALEFEGISIKLVLVERRFVRDQSGQNDDSEASEEAGIGGNVEVGQEQEYDWILMQESYHDISEGRVEVRDIFNPTNSSRLSITSHEVHMKDVASILRGAIPFKSCERVANSMPCLPLISSIGSKVVASVLINEQTNYEDEADGEAHND